jgi:hypothetical protein
VKVLCARDQRAGSIRLQIFIPDNNYQFCDVFVILPNGASDFLTWDISTIGHWIIDRYAPDLKFMTDLNPTKVSLDQRC